MDEKSVPAGHDFEQCEVANSQKRGFWSMFVIMMGFTFFSASMWAGNTLGYGLTPKQFFLAVLAGNLFLGVYCGLLALAAARTGLSIHLLSRHSFGTYGSHIPSIALALTQIGWFGVGVAMFAIPTTVWLKDAAFLQGTWFVTGPTMFVWPADGLPCHLLWTLTVVSGILMTSSAYFGIKALQVISIVAVPAIAVLGGWSAIQALFFDKPEFIMQHNTVLANSGVVIQNGFEALKNHVPEAGKSLGMIMAISMAIGSFISGGTCTPDFTRFSKNSKTAVWTTVLAFFIGNSLMFFFGAAAAMVYDTNDISEVLKIQGLLLPAIIVLGLNIWTTNDNALYTSGLGLANITRLPKRHLVLFNGALGTIFAIWLNNNFCGWLNILNTFIPPCGAIILVDYFIIRRAKYETTAEKKFTPVSIVAVIAWAIGTFFALAAADKLVHIKALQFGLPAVNGLLIAAIVYVILSKCFCCKCNKQ